MANSDNTQPRNEGLPAWVTITVVLVLLALLAYSVIVLGPEGLPLTYFLGGLLGVYGGANELLKARDRQRNSNGNGGNGA